MSDIRDDFEPPLMRADERWNARQAVAVIPPRVKAEVIRRLRAGETFQQITSAVGCSSGTITRLVNKYGLQRKRSRVDLQPARDEAIRLVGEGLSQNEAARRVGVTSGMVSRWVRKEARNGGA